MCWMALAAARQAPALLLSHGPTSAADRRGKPGCSWHRSQDRTWSRWVPAHGLRCLRCRPFVADLTQSDHPRLWPVLHAAGQHGSLPSGPEGALVACLPRHRHGGDRLLLSVDQSGHRRRHSQPGPVDRRQFLSPLTWCIMRGPFAIDWLSRPRERRRRSRPRRSSSTISATRLRTPLSAILGFADLLIAECRPDQRVAIGHIQGGGRRLLCDAG